MPHCNYFFGLENVAIFHEVCYYVNAILITLFCYQYIFSIYVWWIVLTFLIVKFWYVTFWYIIQKLFGGLNLCKYKGSGDKQFENPWVNQESPFGTRGRTTSGAMITWERTEMKLRPCYKEGSQEKGYWEGNKQCLL